MFELRPLHIPACPDDLIHQKQLLGKNRSNIQKLSLYTVTVPHMSQLRRGRFSSVHVNSEWCLFLLVQFLEFDDDFFRVKTRVGGKGSGDDQKSFCEGVNSVLSLTFDGLTEFRGQVLSCSNFKGACSRDDCLVEQGVLDSSESVSDSLLCLGNGVVIWTFDEDGDRERVLDTLNEGVFVISELMLIDMLGESKVFLLEILDGVDGVSAASKGESLHVPPLCSSNTDDVLFGEHVEREWVDSFLVDDNEVFVGSIAHFSLKFNDLCNFVICELSFRFDQRLSLLGRRPEETGVSLCLLVLQADIAGQDIAILKLLGHVWVSGSVVEHKTLDEFGLIAQLVLHVHQFYHVKVNFVVSSDLQDCISDDLCKLLSQFGMDLGHERCSCNLNQCLSVHLLLDLDGLKELQSLILGHLNSIDQHSWMHRLSKVLFSLPQQLSNEEHISSGAIANNVILSSSCSCNHGGSRVLDLHLVKKDIAILGELDLASSSDQHLDGTLRTEVGLQNLLETLSSVNVDLESLGLLDDVCFLID